MLFERILLKSMSTSGKLSKYEVSSMDLICTGMAAGLSLRLLQSMLDTQPCFFSSSKLEILLSAEVTKLKKYAFSFNCAIKASTFGLSTEPAWRLQFLAGTQGCVASCRCWCRWSLGPRQRRVGSHTSSHRGQCPGSTSRT